MAYILDVYAIFWYKLTKGNEENKTPWVQDWKEG